MSLSIPSIHFQQVDKVYSIPVLPKNLVEKPFRRKPQMSAWLVTLNFNKKVHDNEHHYYTSRYLEILKETFGTAENRHEIFKLSPKLKKYENKLTVEKWADPTYFPGLHGTGPNHRFVEVKFQPEVGSKFKRFHMHAIVTISHYTMLRMDYKKFNETIKTCFSNMLDNGGGVDWINGKSKPSNIYAHAKYVPVHQEILHYLNKDTLAVKTDIDVNGTSSKNRKFKAIGFNNHNI